MIATLGQGRPLVLDVTLRDGGYLNDWRFTQAQIDRAVALAARADADLIEVGYLDDRPGLPETAACPPAMLRRVRGLCGDSLLAAMIRPAVADPDAVLAARTGLVDLLRIPLDMRDPAPAVRLAGRCSAHGFAYTFNFVGITCFERSRLSEVAAELPRDAQALYLADSRGNVRVEDVSSLVGEIRKVWAGAIGYHAHDSLGLARANSEAALAAGCELIDGSIAGVGLGGRNLHLRDALALARRSRRDLAPDPEALAAGEEQVGLQAPGDDRLLYRLTGERNLRMEWVAPLVESFGREHAETLLRALPSRFWFDPEELEPYLTPERWARVRW